MKNKCLLGIFLFSLLIGFSTAQDNNVVLKHEIKGIYGDDTSLPSIQATGDKAKVTVLGTYVTDGSDIPNHVIPISDPEVRFHVEYYGHKAEEIRMHVRVNGPTTVTSSSDWLPVQKGKNYSSYFGFQGLTSFFKKGIYEVYLYFETKKGGAGTALSARCLVQFN